jgi:hypothetical protein
MTLRPTNCKNGVNALSISKAIGKKIYISKENAGRKAIAEGHPKCWDRVGSLIIQAKTFS